MNKQKKITTLVYFIVYNLKLEPLFIFLSNFYSPFNKFIPQSSYYKDSDKRTVIRNGVKFKLNLSDYMQWHIFADIGDLSWIEAQKYLHENTVIIDIGANSGAFSLKLAHKIKELKLKNCKIFAFEPNPYMIEALKFNITLNTSLSEIIELYPFGLGDKEEFLPFTFEKNNSGGGRFDPNNSNQPTTLTIKVLDELLKQKNINNISFIKIDVEGHEPFIINGAIETIRKFRPTMYVEITDEWFKQNGSSAIKVLTLLEEENYNLYAEINDEFIDLKDQKNKSKALELKQFNLLTISK